MCERSQYRQWELFTIGTDSVLPNQPISRDHFGGHRDIRQAQQVADRPHLDRTEPYPLHLWNVEPHRDGRYFVPLLVALSAARLRYRNIQPRDDEPDRGAVRASKAQAI